MANTVVISETEGPKVGAVTTAFVASFDDGESVATLEVHVHNADIAVITVPGEIYVRRVQQMAQRALDSGIIVQNGVLDIPKGFAG